MRKMKFKGTLIFNSRNCLVNNEIMCESLTFFDHTDKFTEPQILEGKAGWDGLM